MPKPQTVEQTHVMIASRLTAAWQSCSGGGLRHRCTTPSDCSLFCSIRAFSLSFRRASENWKQGGEDETYLLIYKFSRKHYKRIINVKAHKPKIKALQWWHTPQAQCSPLHNTLAVAAQPLEACTWLSGPSWCWCWTRVVVTLPGTHSPGHTALCTTCLQHLSVQQPRLKIGMLGDVWHVSS